MLKKWIRECPKCQQHDHQQPDQHAPLGTIKAKYPFEKVSWDIIGHYQQHLKKISTY